MATENKKLEKQRIIQKIAMTLFGWPTIGWAFLVWSFNVFVLKKKPYGKFKQYFLRWAFCWTMLYRKKEDFIGLIGQSAPWKIKAITEPHGIHTVAVCKKWT